MSSPRSRVLNTPELLEAILLQLPPKDLLLAQQISQTFQTVITSSPTIQQALFFREASFKHPNTWMINPLLRDHFLPWFVIPGPHGNTIVGPDPDGYIYFHQAGPSVLESLDWARDENKREAFLRAGASWRKMYITQPPARTLEVYEWSEADMGEFLRNARFPPDKLKTPAVTMAIVYDICQSFLVKNPVSDFSMAIGNTVEGPLEICLYLDYTVQCCVEEFVSQRYTSLDSGVWDWSELTTVLRVCSSALPHDRWKTDLTVERGGVTMEEYTKWREEREIKFEDPMMIEDLGDVSYSSDVEQGFSETESIATTL